MNNKMLAIVAVVVLIAGGVVAYFAISDKSGDGGESYDPFSQDANTRLNICGNANMDSYLDQKDIDYIQGILDGTKAETKLSDTNNDGKISSEDIDLLKEIIGLTADKIWYLDINENFAYVEGSVEKLALQYWPSMQALIAVGGEELVTHADSGICSGIEKGTFGEKAKSLGIESFGSGFHDSYDFEKMLSIEVDAIVCGSADIYFIGIEDRFIPDTRINMIRLPFWEGDLVPSSYITLAWLLKDQTYIDNAYEYLDYCKGIMDTIRDGMKKVDKKETVLVNYYSSGSKELDVEVECRGSGSYECSVMAGLDNLASYINTEGKLSSDTMYYHTDVEYLLEKNPDYIIMLGKAGANVTEDESKSTYDKWTEHLTTLDAYTNHNIMVSASGMTSGLYQTINALMIASVVYEDEFEGVDVPSMLQELVDKFTMINDDYKPGDSGYFDVTKQGSWLYIG